MNKRQQVEDKIYKWFLDRIGKRVYRKPWGCTCKSCLVAAHEGIIVTDREHAIYLYQCSAELGIKYQDEPLENTVL